MPLTVQEYQVGQLYSVAMTSMNETGGGEGVEVLRNEAFENYPLLGGRFSRGQYTYKIYHIKSKLPAFIRLLAPTGSTDIHEEAWNAYPYCRTVISNPGYMKDNFQISIETMHLPDNGTTDNAHGLSAEKKALREVVLIDIASELPGHDYKKEEDPTKVKSEKTDRGPLTGSWIQSSSPVMTCYKLVTCEFKWMGLQTRVESFIHKAEARIFTRFHRQVFCWIDRWHGMDLDEIRALEEQIRDDLNKQRKKGSLRGTSDLGPDVRLGAIPTPGLFILSRLRSTVFGGVLVESGC
ncbi:unnamed protein product [Allacma fusca]|uniref:Phosphatidylinositol transfer protein N-terminal domain-containing protein n=1 Tax=Allacma fusca TaxID=39272 RepID=A0A8J2NT61_9HEXA|nr:unnamed protein product [Allacma fusca]